MSGPARPGVPDPDPLGPLTLDPGPAALTPTPANDQVPNAQLSSDQVPDSQPWAATPAAPAGSGEVFSGAPGTPAPPLALDDQRRSVTVGGAPVPLTAKEYLLFELLFVSRGRLFSRDDILGRVWGLDFPGEERIVDAYIRRLRSKLGAGAVETVRGLGYRCPLPETAGVAQPLLQRLPPEARLLTRLAQRILQVTDPGHIIADVYELLREYYGVRGVSLWALPGGTLLAHSGVLAAPAAPPRRGSAAPSGSALVPLGTGSAGEEPWALLGFWSAQQPDQLQHQPPQLTPEWPLEVRSALDAVAGLVNPALRLNSEIRRREEAEQQVRSLNQELEARVLARTRDLVRANADLGALHNLAQLLAGAGSLPDVLSQGLSVLAGLAGATVCSLWRLRTSELHCLAAYTPGRQDKMAELQQDAGALAFALRQSVACTSEHSVLTRTAALSDGRQVLLIPVASGLPEVHALHLELPGPVPRDLSLLDAATRAFGLALERQMQTVMLEQAALNDELTGLPNRRALLADLTAELSYSQRHRTSLTFSLFEIGDIRAINQQEGFAGGNDHIRALADELRATLRLEDRIYRLGGAVLASLVRSVDVQEGAALVARLDALGARFGGGAASCPPGHPLRVSHARSPHETADLSELLRVALERLDHAPAGPAGTPGDPQP